MKVTATKTFRPRNRKGEVIHRGTVLELEDDYAQELIRTDMVVAEGKSLKDYQNKMQAEYEDKGLSLKTETPEQRSQGLLGEGKNSETPEERTQGYGGPEKQKDKEKEKSVELVPAKGETELDPNQKAFFDAESKRQEREKAEADRRRLERFKPIKVADSEEEAERYHGGADKRGPSGPTPMHPKAVSDQQKRDADSKDQKNRDSR